MFMCVFICTCVHQCPQRSKDTRFSGPELRGVCKSLAVGAYNGTQILCK